MKRIAMFSNGRCVAYEEGKIRQASETEKSEYLASQVPATKKGGKLDAVRYNEASKQIEARYAFDNNGETVYKTFAKKIEAQNYNPNQTEPVDGIQDEAKQKENKTEVPRDKAKAKPETKFERPKEVDTPTEVRKKDYGFGEKAKNLHTEVVPRDGSGDGAGGKSVKFEKETAEDATSGNENSYVQKFTPSEKPTPAGNEDNHAVAAETNKETKVAEIKFQPEGLLGIFNRGEKTASKDADDEKDKKPNPFAKKEEENYEEKDEKSEDKGKKASIDEDIVNKYREAKSQLDEVSSELHQAKVELNKMKIREARMSKAIEYTLALQEISPEKFADTDTFLTKVSETVKKMNVEAIDDAIVGFREAKRSITEARRTASLRSGENTVGLESALVIPRVEEGFWVNKNDLSSILMANTSLGKQVSGYDDYKPHEKSW